METIRQIINSNLLSGIIQLPSAFRNKRVEVVVSVKEENGLPMFTEEELDEMIKGSITDCWNDKSDYWYDLNAASHEVVKQNPKLGFPLDVYPAVQKHLGDFSGKKILVPSSGDNVAAFAFHLLGAKVTSCDLSQKQIENAAKIAKANGWDIEFVVQDTMLLDKINDNEYDLVYTSNGAHVWISDMQKMYHNINRVLKNGGYSIFFETHPMGRPFDMATYDVKIANRYDDIHRWANDDVPNYLWRTQEFVNAIASNGFVIKEMLEFTSRREDLLCHNYLSVKKSCGSNDNSGWHGDTFDWTNNPWAALPTCLFLCSQKKEA